MALAGVGISCAQWWISRSSSTAAGDVGDDGLPHHRLEQLRLVREIEVERALGDAGALGHRVEPRRREAALGKAGERRVQNLPGPCLLAAAPTGRRGRAVAWH